MAELIDRQAAIDALDRIFDRCEEIEAHLPEGDPDRTGYKMFPDYMIVWKYLHQLPSAESERTGRWIKPNNPVSILLNEWICSNCNYLISGKHNFCPNCGADMRGEQDG